MKITRLISLIKRCTINTQCIHTLSLGCGRLALLLTLIAFSSSLIADNISDSNKYAWSTSAGWFNFKSTEEQVTVYDDHLEGYIWAENVGWIRLGTQTSGAAHTYANTSATNYGVNNDGSGNLSGYAWSTTIGWINFNPSHSQVTIDNTSGDLDGYAWSENIGWIHFQNSSPAYKVQRILTDVTSFSFTDQTSVARNTFIESNSITVSGINTTVAISITGGEYEINGNGTWLSTDSTVEVNDTVIVKHASSISYSTTINTTLTIGAQTDTFSSTTLEAPAPAPAPIPEPTPEPTAEVDPPVIDISTPEPGEESVLETLQKTPDIVGDDNALSLSQDPATNNIQASIGDRTFELKPIQVTQAPEGTEAGIYVTPDGTIELVTETGQQVSLLTEPRQLQEMINVFKEFGLEVTRGAFGSIRFNPSATQRAATNEWFSARVSVDSNPVEDITDTRTGLISMASGILENVLIYAQQFEEDGVLYRQYLCPTPADWGALKIQLNAIGSDVSIDLDGLIQATIGDRQYQALMDYKVVSGAYSTSDGLYFILIEDLNGDGTKDYEVVYSNGDKQLLYILP